MNRSAPSFPKKSHSPRRRVIVAFLCFAAAPGCGEESTGPRRINSRPADPVADFTPIVHTTDGRRLAFTAAGFQPNSIEHCRDDGYRHLTPIYELAGIQPAGHGASLCPELSGRFLRFQLIFRAEPAIKVTSLCEEGCVTPGGYYPPLGVDVRIPWSQIAYIEFQQE